ncbi:hypothetical protein KY487_22560, partial [Ralstonia pseudosolanacearum]
MPRCRTFSSTHKRRLRDANLAARLLDRNSRLGPMHCEGNRQRDESGAPVGCDVFRKMRVASKNVSPSIIEVSDTARLRLSEPHDEVRSDFFKPQLASHL